MTRGPRTSRWRTQLAVAARGGDPGNVAGVQVTQNDARGGQRRVRKRESHGQHDTQAHPDGHRGSRRARAGLPKLALSDLTEPAGDLTLPGVIGVKVDQSSLRS